MSNHDGEMKAAGEVSGELEEWLVALGRPLAGGDRHDAMAHYLSGDEGWRDALKRLRGAFARPSHGRRGSSGGSEG